MNGQRSELTRVHVHMCIYIIYIGEPFLEVAESTKHEYMKINQLF